jgi:Ca2+-binding RTX toxin-like protein
LAIKSVTIFIDSFSDRVFDLGHDNVHLFDFGFFNQETWLDTYVDPNNAFSISGYGNYDTYVVDVQDQVGGFYYLTPDTDFSGKTNFITTTTNSFDYDLKNSYTFKDIFGFDVFADSYYAFHRADQTSSSLPNHGDWTLAAYLSELENPEQNEIICIDVDTLNGANSHYDRLFSENVSLLSWLSTVSGLESVLEQFLLVNDKRFTGNEYDDEYTISCLSVSIAGAPATQEIDTLNLLETWNIPVVQAAPNVGQGDFDWGSNYPDVVNVGAWNVDSSGNLLLSSQNTLTTLDILGNGLVSHPDWGSNFGTSFATPKVAADITNAYNNVIDEIEAQGTSLSSAQQQVAELDIDYSAMVESVLNLIGTDIVALLSNAGNPLLYSPRVRNADLLDDAMPDLVPFTAGGIEGLSVATATINTGTPVFTSTPSLTIQQDTAYFYNFSANDPDAGDFIVYVCTEKPDWLNFDGLTRELTGTPSNEHIGSHTVEISAVDLEGGTDTQSFTLTVQNLNDDPIGLPAIVGTPRVDNIITASIDAISDADGLGDISYQWFRDEREIIGATLQNYTLTNLDVGTELTVQIAYTDGHGTLEIITSNAAVGQFGLQVYTSSSFDCRIASHIETLTLEGRSDIYGYGNDNDNLISGNAGRNTLKGGNGDDTLDGGKGNDLMMGGSGNDIYFVDNLKDKVFETTAFLNNITTDAGGIDQIFSTVSVNLDSYNGIKHVENLTLLGESNIKGLGNDNDNIIYGNTGKNKLTGGNGNDTLDGGAGIDVMMGGAGNDSYYVDNFRDKVFETTTFSKTDTSDSGGTDHIYSSVRINLDTYNGIKHVENLTLTGNSNIFGYGNNKDNTIIGNFGRNKLKGCDGDDTLNGGNGDDLMMGGAGNDIYYVDSFRDQVFESSSFSKLDTTDAGGTDIIYSTANVNMNAYNGIKYVEDLILQGDGNIFGFGNNLNNIISGNNGKNVIKGGIGSDTLVSSGARDLFYVGIDADADLVIYTDVSHTIVGSDRDRIYQFDSGEDKISFKEIDADSTLDGVQQFTFSAIGPEANAFWLRKANNNVLIQGDVNGDLLQDFEILIVNQTSLTVNDFIL